MKYIVNGLFALLIISSLVIPFWEPAPVQATTSVDIRLSADLDDCLYFYSTAGAGWVFDLNGSAAAGEQVGYYTTDQQKIGSGLRFRNVTIPKSATITTAYITFTAMETNTNAGVKSVFTGLASDNASVFSTATDFKDKRGTIISGANNNNITTENVTWDSIASFAAGSSYNSPELKTIIQVIVNRSGWASGNCLALFWDDFGGRSPVSNSYRRKVYAYLDSPSQAPLLHVEYTTGSSTATTSAASSVATTTAVLNGSQNTSTASCDYQGFVWDTVSRSDPGNTAPASSSYAYNWTESGTYATGSSFNYTAPSLTNNTLYYFRACAHDTSGWFYGSQLSFTTLLAITPPSINATEATSISTTTAQLNASVIDSGGQNSDVRFAYDNVTHVSIGDYAFFTAWDNDTYTTGSTPYKAITGLNFNNTYFFRAQIANDNATAVSSELTFATANGVNNPTSPVAISSADNISLNWVKGVGSSNTIIRYQAGSYPTAPNQGTSGYTGEEESVKITGLDEGTTYYISLWGLTSGVYSDNYSTVLCTTTVGAEEKASIPASDYTTPTEWFQAPNYTRMSGFPLYDVVNWGADTFHVPRATDWFTLAMIFCMSIGVLVYRMSTNIPASAGSIAVTIVFCSFMGLMEMWLVLPFVLIGVGAWIQGTRA